ncbi:MAG: hypothetical protein LBL58_16280 [Tannerellaceae bacterium]|jgi:hypothetical protein|nr:hypothetical protein [Tannerellaceae bacterium]
MNNRSSLYVSVFDFILIDINEKIIKQYPLRIKDMSLETDAGDILHYIVTHLISERKANSKLNTF